MIINQFVTIASKEATTGNVLTEDNAPPENVVDNVPPTDPVIEVTDKGEDYVEITITTESTDAFGIAGYDLRQDGVLKKSNPYNSLVFTASGLQGGTEYSFQVVARDPSGNPAYSNTVTETTNADSTPPTLAEATVDTPPDDGSGICPVRSIVGTDNVTPAASIRYFFKDVADGAGQPAAPIAADSEWATESEWIASGFTAAALNPRDLYMWGMDDAENITPTPLGPISVDCTSPGVSYTGLKFGSNAGTPDGLAFGSNIFTGTVSPNTPVPPSNPLIDVLSPSALNLSWQNAQNTNGYTGIEIEISVNSAAYAPETTATLNGSPYNDTGLTPGDTVQYRLRSITATQQSSWAYSAEVTMPTSGQYPPLDNLQATALSPYLVNVFGQTPLPVGNVHHWNVYRVSPAGKVGEIDVTGTSLQVSASPDTPYGFYVRAANEDNSYEGAASNTAQVTTPEAPTAGILYQCGFESSYSIYQCNGNTNLVYYLRNVAPRENGVVDYPTVIKSLKPEVGSRGIQMQGVEDTRVGSSTYGRYDSCGELRMFFDPVVDLWVQVDMYLPSEFDLTDQAFYGGDQSSHQKVICAWEGGDSHYSDYPYMFYSYEAWKLLGCGVCTDGNKFVFGYTTTHAYDPVNYWQQNIYPANYNGNTAYWFHPSELDTWKNFIFRFYVPQNSSEQGRHQIYKDGVLIFDVSTNNWNPWSPTKTLDTLYLLGNANRGVAEPFTAYLDNIVISDSPLI